VKVGEGGASFGVSGLVCVVLEELTITGGAYWRDTHATAGQRGGRDDRKRYEYGISSAAGQPRTDDSPARDASLPWVSLFRNEGCVHVALLSARNWAVCEDVETNEQRINVLRSGSSGARLVMHASWLMLSLGEVETEATETRAGGGVSEVCRCARVRFRCVLTRRSSTPLCLESCVYAETNARLLLMNKSLNSNPEAA
jgi:hypothetical protein